MYSFCRRLFKVLRINRVGIDFLTELKFWKKEFTNLFGKKTEIGKSDSEKTKWNFFAVVHSSATVPVSYVYQFSRIKMIFFNFPRQQQTWTGNNLQQKVLS